ncbi:MAG: DNA repair protein RecO, partial [Calditrichia bacterium]|nr:DNA repair protein RecO [Calditrichia bacterium]
MRKVLLQSAYVLQVRPYRDTSALVEIFTPDHGRISLVARGVRSGNSKIRGLLQPFRKLLVSWSGDKELKSLISVEEDGEVIGVKAGALVSALYVNELLVRLLHRHEEHESLFDLYRNTLRTLEGTDNISKALRLFEKSLLQELG